MDEIQETSQFKKFLKPETAILLILAIGIAALGFYFWQKKAVQIPKPAYTQAYRLVQEKISQSAIIAITLPPKIDKLSAKSNIEFTPEIKGDWLGEKPQAGIVLAAENSETVYFKPKEKLNLNVIGYQLFSKIPGEIRVTVSDGFKIYFNRDDDLENAFVVIKTVLEEEIKEKRSRLDYIDARFGNKVFYKLR